MKHLFYSICEAITENITGLDNGSLKLWELGEWLQAYDTTKLIVNLSTLAIILLVGYVLADIGLFVFEKIERKLSAKEIES